MGVSIRWLDDSKIVLSLEFESPWTWEEFSNASEQVNTMLDTLDHVADVIIDFRKSKGLPAGFLSQARKMGSKSHPKRGIVVIVGANRFIQVAVDTVRAVYRQIVKNIQIADTVEEAQALLATQRAAHLKPTERGS